MTSLVRFDPWGMLRKVDRVFEGGGRRRSTAPWLPRVDVFDVDANLVVRAEVPGVDLENVEVTVENGSLTISSVRGFSAETETEGRFRRKEIFEGRFKRTIALPEGADADAISATSKDGILEITVPKQPELLPHKVTVDVQR